MKVLSNIHDDAKVRCHQRWHVVPVSCDAWCVWDDGGIEGPFKVLAHAVNLEDRSCSGWVLNSVGKRTDVPEAMVDIDANTLDLTFADSFWLVAQPTPSSDGSRWLEEKYIFFSQDAAEIASPLRKDEWEEERAKRRNNAPTA